jgi:DNA-binding MarR family transcriptional regulator
VTNVLTENGVAVSLGLLAVNLPFMVRNLQTLIRLEGDAIRGELELKAGSIGILFVIAENPGISQNDIATATVLNKTAVANIVKPLEAALLLCRHRSSEDARVNVLSLTAKGRRLMKRAEALLDDLHERAFAHVSQTEREAFFRVCTRVIANLDERIKFAE